MVGRANHEKGIQAAERERALTLESRALSGLGLTFGRNECAGGVG